MNTTKESVILLPGLSGGVMSDRFTPFQDKAEQDGYDFIRFNAWENQDRLEELSLREIHQELDNLIEGIKGKVHIIGKSFGGAITLKYRNPKLVSMVLLAPALGIGEESIDSFRFVSDFKQKVIGLQILQESPGKLQELNIPIHIIHGTQDRIIPLENSKALTSIVLQGSLYKLEGGDHSFCNNEHERELIDNAFSFISTT